MKKLFLLFALMVLIASCSASTISRSFNSSEIAPGADLAVALTVNVTGGETFYLIDELVPAGWTVKDAGTGSAEHQGHIKWVVIQGAENTTYSYVLTAPQQEGDAAFEGTYMFEGMAAEAQIGGQKLVNVKTPSLPPEPVGMDLTLLAAAVIVLVIVAVAAFFLTQKKKKK